MRMKSLAELQHESKRDGDMINPRLFLALFPTGPFNGKFLDPYLGLLEINGIGIVKAHELNMFDIPAIWADQQERTEQ